MAKIQTGRYLALQKLTSAVKDIFSEGLSNLKEGKAKLSESLEIDGFAGSTANAKKKLLDKGQEFMSSYAGKTDLDIETNLNPSPKANVDDLQKTDKILSINRTLNKSVKIDDERIAMEAGKNASDIISFVEGGFRNDANLVKIANKVKNLTGIELDIKLDAETSLSNFKSQIRRVEQEKIYDRIIASHFDELTNAYAPDVLNELVKTKAVGMVKGKRHTISVVSPKIKDIFAEYDKLDLLDKMSVMERTKSLVASHRSTAYKEALESMNVSYFDQKLSTIPDKLNNLYVFAKKNNMNMTANVLDKFNDFIDASHGTINRLNMLERDVIPQLKKLDVDDPNKARALRKYATSIFQDVDQLSRNLDDTNSIVKDIDGIYSERIRVDKEALSAIEAEYKVKFNLDDLEMVNEQTNLLSSLRVAELNNSLNKIIKEEIPATRKDMQFRKWNNDLADEFFTNDLTKNQNNLYDNGRSYRPIVITDGYKESVLKNLDVDERAKRLILDKKSRKFEYETYNKLRTFDAKAELDENRLMPGDEMEIYLRKFKNNLIRNKGKSYITALQSTISKEASYMSNLTEADLDRSVQHRPRREGMPMLVQEVSDNWMDAFSYTEKSQNAVVNGLLALTDLNTAFALLSPKMLVMNTLQPFVTGSPYKGIMNTWYGYTKSSGIWKEIFAGKGIDEAIKSIADNKLTPLEAKSLNTYFAKYMPDALQSDLWAGGGKLEPVKEAITHLFRATDVHSRLTSALAAVKMADDILGKHGDDFLMGAKGSDLSLKKLIKELHLKEFNALEQKKLINSLHKGREDFVVEFAHASMNKELFNYSMLNRPGFIDKMKKDPFLARAARFMTWSLYYKGSVDGIIRSAASGDTEPAKKLLYLTSAWLAGASLAAGTEIPFVSDLGSYAVGRAPLISPAMSLVDTVRRPVGGILVPAVSTMMYPITAGFNAITNVFGSGNDSFDYLEREYKRNMLKQPIINNTWGTLKKAGENLDIL